MQFKAQINRHNYEIQNPLNTKLFEYIIIQIIKLVIYLFKNIL